MKNNKLLVTINKLDEINKLKELGITKYVFPLKDFCVGIPNTFSISEINEEAYIFINRILDNRGIDELKNILNNLPENIIGIVFDDLGVYELVKDKNIEKILYLSHFNCNSESVNHYLELIDSVILSTDITKDEIEYIIEHVNKKICLFTFGYVGVMYSRRLLIDNYVKFHNLNYENPIKIKNDNNEFLVYENEYGTYFYHNKIFNGNSLLDFDAKYFFINSAFLSIEEIEKFILGEDIPNSDEGFLYTETIYKLKGDENV